MFVPLTVMSEVPIWPAAEMGIGLVPGVRLIMGAGSTVSVKLCVASVPTPLCAVKVII